MFLQMSEILSKIKCWIFSTSLVGDFFFFFFTENLCLSVTDIFHPLHVVSLDTFQNYSKKHKMYLFNAMMQESSDQLRCKA